MKLHTSTIQKAVVIRYMTSYLQLYPSLSLAEFNQRYKRVQALLRRVAVSLNQSHPSTKLPINRDQKFGLVSQNEADMSFP